MPFQSEKQRRFLHANHPEIAKRWERDYANGGISNHFRKRFASGTWTPGAGRDTRGYQSSHPQHSGGGGGGGGGPKPHSGPTFAEIQAQKKAAADLVAANAKKRRDEEQRAIYEDTMGRRKENIKHYDENLKSKFDALGTVEGALNTAQTGMGLYNTYKTLKNLKNINPYTFAFSKIFPKIVEKGLEKANVIKKPEKTLEEILEIPDEGTPGSPHEDEYEYDFAAKNGGILDINESEEIISDDGNDIELTDYNAAFDDPNDLSTGVKSLFQAKDGGRINYIYGGISHPDGRRGFPGGAGTPGGYDGGGGKTGNGSHDRGGKQHQKTAQTSTKSSTSTNGKDYGPYSKGPPIDTSPKDDDGRSIHLKTKQYYPKRYKESITHNPFVEGPIVTNIRDYYDPRNSYQNRAPKNEKEKTLLDQIIFWGGILTGVLPAVGIKVPGAITTANKFLGYRQNFDWTMKQAKKFGLIDDTITADSVLDSIMEKAKKQKAKMDEYKSLPKGHPDKIALGIELQVGKTTEDGGSGDEPKPPQIRPITEDIQEYEEMAQDPMSNWAAMKQKQALNTQLQEQWENEMASWSANSGGLANLFRVKNQ